MSTAMVAGHEMGRVKTTVQRLILAIGGNNITRKEIMEKLHSLFFIGLK